jgi:hypothetical protein
VAKLVIEHVPNYVGGKLWARRYSFQVLPRSEDVEHWFYYAALNPVTSKLCRHPKDYLSYNSFWDAATNTQRAYTVFERMAYNERKRFDRSVKRKDYEKVYTLTFSRLPGMEELSPQEYEEKLKAAFEQRRQDLIAEKGFAPVGVVNSITAGASPYRTKRSRRYSFRPLVLSLCRKAKLEFLKKYFDLLDRFKEASQKFLQGASDVVFPTGTYPPCKVAVR